VEPKCPKCNGTSFCSKHIDNSTSGAIYLFIIFCKECGHIIGMLVAGISERERIREIAGETSGKTDSYDHWI
jgi:hypothetical protein